MENPIYIKAVRAYEKQRQHQKKWREHNKERVNENAKKYYEKLREDTERYAHYLEMCRKRYAKKNKKAEDPEKENTQEN